MLSLIEYTKDPSSFPKAYKFKGEWNLKAAQQLIYNYARHLEQYPNLALSYDTMKLPNTAEDLLLPSAGGEDASSSYRTGF